jgi:hypothetical protein
MIDWGDGPRRKRRGSAGSARVNDAVGSPLRAPVPQAERRVPPLFAESGRPGGVDVRDSERLRKDAINAKARRKRAYAANLRTQAGLPKLRGPRARGA